MSSSASSGARVVGVVVAAGRSDRFGGDVPKQFLDLAGKSVLARAVEALASRPGLDGVVVVLAPDQVAGPRCDQTRRLPGVKQVVAGEPTRAGSVWQGLQAVKDAGHVLVHDAARPLAPPALVDAVLETTLEHGAAVPVLPVPDTVKEVDGSGFVAGTLNRAALRLAQTPQGARVDWLLNALGEARREGVEVTDEAAALERAGHRVMVVPGDPDNFKITTAGNLERARNVLEGGSMDLRVGTGFDIHRFGAGRRLVLGGVAFPEEEGLEGHSDADVVLHAVMDALLGAASLGDIGSLFPPEDPRFENAASTDLAERVARTLREAGFEVVNVDVTLLAERPRIRERTGEMRRALAACLGIRPERIGIKATTLEGIGGLGRAEGIACQSVALVRRREGSR